MKYTIYPHGDDYALYYGTHCLINMTEPAWNFDPKHIEKLLNLGAAEYHKNPDAEYLAE
jgi:hypothetical protein